MGRIKYKKKKPTGERDLHLELWSKKKKHEMDGKPHQSRPDKDNLEKALLDAIYEEDSHVWDSRVTKVWGYYGAIVIDDMPF